MLAQQHFGNPLVEQRELKSGTAVAILEPKGIIRVCGEDRLSWLHSLLSQKLLDLSPGESREALLLDPQGRIEHLIHVIEDGECSWLIVAKEKSDDLFRWLEKMVFRKKVTLEDLSAKYQVVGSAVRIPEMASVNNATPLVWEDPWPGTSTGGFRYGKVPVDFSWFEHLIETTELEGKLSGRNQAGTIAVEALRIAAFRPTVSEIDNKSLPHELDLLSTAVHLAKGCYRGQETVAKVHNLGHPPRRLVLLHLDGTDPELPAVGSEICVSGQSDGKGKVTSVAQHFEMGPIALAVIQRSVPEDVELVVMGSAGPVAATQQVVVPKEAGKQADIPKLPRLKLGGPNNRGK